MKVHIDKSRLKSLANSFMELNDFSSTSWNFEGLPFINEECAINYFFTGVKHQYGFWLDDGSRYTSPMFGVINGKRLKGSDFIWHALTRSARQYPEILLPEHQVTMTDKEIANVFSSDDGSCPLPLFDTHCQLWREYARDMIATKQTAQEIINIARASKHPIQNLYKRVSELSGYKEDPFLKKASLLVMAIANRPERFLGDKVLISKIAPIVDYHNMRSALRIGLINIEDPQLKLKLTQREFINAEEEYAIRSNTYQLLNDLAKMSDMSVDSIDWFFFQNRISCPEMTKPNCEICGIKTICAQRTELFQPIIRTTFY